MNINEIAELAGVSRATVSRYLNNGYVSSEKKEAIRKIIEETGYQPSSQAQQLRTKRTRLVGVIIPKISSSSIARMVSGIGDELSKSGYQMILANTNNNIVEEQKYLSIFRDNQVDGIIFMGTIFTKRHFTLMKECRVPIVILGQHLPGYPCVFQDDYHAAMSATQILMEKGKKIAFIGVTERDEAVGKNRRAGFEAALKSRKIFCPASWLKRGEFNIQSGYERAKELFEEEWEIDTIFCATDNLAIGAMKYLKEVGKRIPEDVQLMGMGDTTVGSVVEPYLSTVHFHYESSGAQAASILKEMMDSKEKKNAEIKMGYYILQKQTTR